MEEQGLLLWVFTERAAWFKVSLSLHLNGDGVEVVGGVTSLGHLPQDGLSIHRFIYGHMCGEQGLVHGEGPDVQVVNGCDAFHLQQTSSHLAVLHSRWDTLHQHHQNIFDDGEGGAQDQDGEEEGADRVSDLVLRLEEDDERTDEDADALQ